MHFAVARSQVLAGCLLEIISFLPHGPLHGEAYITSNFSRASQQERKRTGGHKNESGREREVDWLNNGFNTLREKKPDYLEQYVKDSMLFI